MKQCEYCGRENEDAALHCAGCGTAEFVSAVPRAAEDEVLNEEGLVRDRPKFVIVAGIWMIFGAGLVANILHICEFLTGTISGIFGFFYFCLSIGYGALCVYMLHRVVKNYKIHKQRAKNESVA
jgi:hypothetical protein